MKTKIFILAALLGAAAMSANAGVRFGISIGLPLPVVVSSPVVYAPVTVVQSVPPCPGVDYVWAPGYWSYLPTGRVWVAGAWHYRATDYDRGHARDSYNHNRHDRDGHDRDHDGYRR
jgi:hypothetical protein